MMKWIDNFDLFLFDFDGLLVDTESLHLEAYRQLCQNHGFTLDWTLDKFFDTAHMSSEGIRLELQRLFPKMTQETAWDILYSEKKKIYESLLQKGSLSLMPGVRPLLEALAQLEKKRCVVTNSTLTQTESIKRQIPLLQTIPHWFTRESYVNPKPAPDGYLKALEMLKAPGDRVIGFEDSMRGYESLKAAGVQTAVLICPASHPQLTQRKPGTWVASFEQLSE